MKLKKILCVFFISFITTSLLSKETKTKEINSEENKNENLIQNKDEINKENAIKEKAESKQNQKESKDKDYKKTTSDYINDINSGDSYLQINACLEISKSKDKSAISSLISLLEDENADLLSRNYALLTLKNFKEEESVINSLFNITNNSDNNTLKYNSLITILEINSEVKKDELKILLSNLEKNKDPILNDLVIKIINKKNK